MVTDVTNTETFDQELGKHEDLALFFYGDFSEISKKALEEYRSLSEEKEIQGKVPCYSVNVSAVKGLHTRFNVKNVPSLIVFRKGKAAERLQGEQKREALKNTLLGNQRFFKRNSDGGEEARRFPPVTVYSTPTCGFCTKLKNYLKEQGVPYKDIDIARDSSAAQKLVSRTGQQGVPQSFIGGTHIMGFDKPKINRLLGLQ